VNIAHISPHQTAEFEVIIYAVKFSVFPFVSVYTVNISSACGYSLQTCSSVSVVTKLQSRRQGLNTGHGNIIFRISLETASDASLAGYDIGSQGTLQKENLYRGTLPKENLYRGTLPKENLYRGTLPKENMYRGTLPKENLYRGTLPKENLYRGT